MLVESSTLPAALPPTGKLNAAIPTPVNVIAPIAQTSCHAVHPPGSAQIGN
jgi:hypothetical protein